MDEINTNVSPGRLLFDRVQAVIDTPSWSERDIVFASAMIVIIEQIGLMVGQWADIHAALKGRLEREQRRN